MVQETVFNLVDVADGAIKFYGARLWGRRGHRWGGCWILALSAGQGKRKSAGRLWRSCCWWRQGLCCGHLDFTGLGRSHFRVRGRGATRGCSNSRSDRTLPLRAWGYLHRDALRKRLFIYDLGRNICLYMPVQVQLKWWRKPTLMCLCCCRNIKHSNISWLCGFVLNPSLSNV